MPTIERLIREEDESTHETLQTVKWAALIFFIVLLIGGIAIPMWWVLFLAVPVVVVGGTLEMVYRASRIKRGFTKVALIRVAGDEAECSLLTSQLDRLGISSHVRTLGSRDVLHAEASDGMHPRGFSYEIWVRKRDLKRALSAIPDD